MLVTVHRRESWGHQIEEICRAISEIATSHPELAVLFPVHLNPVVLEPVHQILGGLPNVQLTIPLAKGGISTVVIFSALQAWNGFLFPLIFTQSDGPRVLTLGLFNYVSQFGVNIPALLASVVLSGIPIFAVYLVARRALVGGLMGVGGK